MSKVNMFEQATRMRLRFAYKGTQSVEDIWKMSNTDMEDLYGQLKNKQKTEPAKGLFKTGTKSKDDEKLELQLAIIEHIASVRDEEKEANAMAAAKKAKREKVLAELANREDNSYKTMSDEELMKLLEE